MSGKPTYPLTDNSLTSLLEYRPSASSPSSVISLVALPPGALLTTITTATPTATPAYSSVQVSQNKHIELNSALLYMNHSCTPNLEIHTHLDPMEVRVVKNGTGVKPGDMLTFFYPSTEWKMDRAFQCECGAKECFGMITGAKEMASSDFKVRGLFMSTHVHKMFEEREGTVRESNGHMNGHAK